MKKYFLLPHCFYAIGWVLVGVALLVSILDFSDVLPTFSSKVISVIPGRIFGTGFIMSNDSWYDEIEMITGFLGLYFIAMSALRKEDEMTLLLRLRSLMWAFTANTILFVALDLLVYGYSWVYILIYQGMFIFLLFILRFHWELRKMKISISKE